MGAFLLGMPFAQAFTAIFASWPLPAAIEVARLAPIEWPMSLPEAVELVSRGHAVGDAPSRHAAQHRARAARRWSRLPELAEHSEGGEHEEKHGQKQRRLLRSRSAGGSDAVRRTALRLAPGAAQPAQPRGIF